MTLHWTTHKLELASPFRIAKGTFHFREALIVQMEHNGMIGWGEATAITYYGISVEELSQLLQRYKQDLEKLPLETPEQFHQLIYRYFPQHPFLLSALDCAAYDLYGKLHGCTTRSYLGGANLPTDIPTSFTIGLGTPAEMAQKVSEKPWPIYKIKLGQSDDISLIEGIRKVTDAPLRIDANEGWKLDEAREKISTFKHLGVELIEQPLPRTAIADMHLLHEDRILPLIADESCLVERDVDACHGLFHGINIKLMKCGGITPAVRMIRRARELGMQVMIGCMTETSIGISAAAQLIPWVDYVDLDGSMLIKEDIASGVKFVQGFPQYPHIDGSGCEMPTKYIP